MRSQGGRASGREGERVVLAATNMHKIMKHKLHVITHLFKRFPRQINKESVSSIHTSSLRHDEHEEGGATSLSTPQPQHNTSHLHT